MKFKVWCIKKNEFEQHQTLISENGMLWHFSRNTMIPLNQKTHGIMWDTKLKDKNGTKIYTGDIIKLEDVKQPTGVYECFHDVNYEVAYSFDMMYANVIDDFDDAKYYHGFKLSDFCDGCCVVGNIYEK